jgi:diguanylate cyclase (GGDEF)-like protein
MKMTEFPRIFILCMLYLLSSLSGIVFLYFSLALSFLTMFTMVALILFFRDYVNKVEQLQLTHIEQKRIYKASITDGMTGLYNHTHMLNMLREAVPPYSVVMLDIDNLKEINDSYGHRFGDAAILYLAYSLKQQVRSSDLVFRYGGDEFIIILLGCPVENAKEIALKIKDRIETGFRDEKSIPLTLSGGIYYVARKEEPESVFDKVDSVLYRAKNKGKNNISVYEQL